MNKTSLFSKLLALSAFTLAGHASAFDWPHPPPPPPPPQLPSVPSLPSIAVPPPPAPPPLPVLLPRPCASGCDVNKDQRALLLVNLVSQGDRYKPMYQFMENGGRATIDGTLRPLYGQYKDLSGSSATSTNFADALTSFEHDSRIQAIDVVVILHGNPDGSVQFADGTTKVDGTLSNAIASRRVGMCASAPDRNACVAGLAKKDRAVINTACFGSAAFSGWKTIGFDAYDGSRGVYSDSVASFPAMLEAWSKGYTFGEAIDRGNAADSRHTYDAWARVMGFSDVDSTRIVNGARGESPARAMTIFNRPQ